MQGDGQGHTGSAFLSGQANGVNRGPGRTPAPAFSRKTGVSSWLGARAPASQATDTSVRLASRMATRLCRTMQPQGHPSLRIHLSCKALLMRPPIHSRTAAGTHILGPGPGGKSREPQIQTLSLSSDVTAGGGSAPGRQNGKQPDSSTPLLPEFQSTTDCSCWAHLEDLTTPDLTAGVFGVSTLCDAHRMRQRMPGDTLLGVPPH